MGGRQMWWQRRRYWRLDVDQLVNCGIEFVECGPSRDAPIGARVARQSRISIVRGQYVTWDDTRTTILATDEIDYVKFDRMLPHGDATADLCIDAASVITIGE